MANTKKVLTGKSVVIGVFMFLLKTRFLAHILLGRKSLKSWISQLFAEVEVEKNDE
mgnify:CR=1 FL=1